MEWDPSDTVTVGAILSGIVFVLLAIIGILRGMFSVVGKRTDPVLAQLLNRQMDTQDKRDKALDELIKSIADDRRESNKEHRGIMDIISKFNTENTAKLDSTIKATEALPGAMGVLTQQLIQAENKIEDMGKTMEGVGKTMGDQTIKLEDVLQAIQKVSDQLETMNNQFNDWRNENRIKEDENRKREEQNRKREAEFEERLEKTTQDVAQIQNDVRRLTPIPTTPAPANQPVLRPVPSPTPEPTGTKPEQKTETEKKEETTND
jgi:chromosome segregation ATPase